MMDIVLQSKTLYAMHTNVQTGKNDQSFLKLYSGGLVFILFYFLDAGCTYCTECTCSLWVCILTRCLLK